MPTAMNAANEIAVGLFMQGKIPFLKIEEMVERVMEEHQTIAASQSRSDNGSRFTRSKNGVCYGRMNYCLIPALGPVKVVFYGDRNCVYSHIWFSRFFS